VDIVAAFDDAFLKLKTLSEGNVEIFWDKSALSAGSPARLVDSLQDKLSDSDYLIIIYTGAFRTSISYPSTEYGFFLGQIRADRTQFGASERKIVRVYFDGRPPVESGQLDVEIDVTSTEFQQSTDDYRKTVLDSAAKRRYSLLVNTFEDIGAMADRRLPKGKRQEDVPAGEWSRRIGERTKALPEKIIPELMVSLHDALRVRIKNKTIEQRFIEFKLPASASQSVDSIGDLPQDAILTDHAGSFSIFGASSNNGTTTWNNFKADIMNTMGGKFTISSVERSAISAISPNIIRDDEQLIRDHSTKQVYRIIISSQWEYYDASRVINMMFVPTIWLGSGMNSDASITIGYIAIASKARDLFLHAASPLSVDAFERYDFSEMQTHAHQILKEMDIIKDQVHALGLDQQESIVIYFGNDKEAARRAGEMTLQFAQMEDEFNVAANHLLTLSVCPGRS
jgi:hypothetical protein